MRGSEDAFRDIVLQYQRPVFSLIVRMVQDPRLAEDLAQEVFIKAYRALSTYDLNRKFSSWLFKIAHNTTIDYLRKGRLQTEPFESQVEGEASYSDTLEDPRAESPEGAVERTDLAQAIEKAILGLRPEYREVMVLRYQEGLSYQEIVEATGLALGTVKTNIHRARKEMMALLQEGGWAPPSGSRTVP